MPPIIVACAVLVMIGLAPAVRWGGLAFSPPTHADGARVRRLLWTVDVHLLAGLVTGLLVIGPGGRLAMRLLAVTAGDAAQGRLTEAEEVVGRVTIGGTIGFVVFTGLFGGLLVALVFAVLRRWLPASGRRSALVVAAVLAVTAATRIDPLRPANPDFGLVGPTWLAVAVFLALLVATCLSASAVAARLSRAIPPLHGWAWRPLLAHLPLVLLVLPGPAFVALGLLSGLGLALTSWPPIARVWSSDRVVLVGRVVLAVVVVALLPWFVGDLAALG